MERISDTKSKPTDSSWLLFANDITDPRVNKVLKPSYVLVGSEVGPHEAPTRVDHMELKASCSESMSGFPFANIRDC